MGELSSGRKAVLAAQVAGRMTTQAVRNSRFLRATWEGARASLAALARVLHRIWLEITGVFFLLFAFAGGAAVWREYPMYKVGRADLLHLVAPVLFAALFAWFGVTSFWRAHRKAGPRA